MLILGEPTLETRQFELRVEASSHPGLVRILEQSRMRRSDRATAAAATGRYRAPAVGLRTLRVMMMMMVMVRRRRQRIYAETYLLLLQPRFEIPLCLLRQVVAASAEGQQSHLQGKQYFFFFFKSLALP